MTIKTSRDAEREREVARYGVIGVAQPELEDLVQVAAQLCHVPAAAINLLQGETQATVAAVGVDRGACSLEDSMCDAVLYAGHPVQVADASVDPRWDRNPWVTGERASFRFYAAHQLASPRGVVIGTLCVFDYVPRELTARENDALRRIALRVVDLLELRLRTRELEETVADLTRTRNELQRSNDLLGLFAGQVAHDLRGPITAVNVSLGILQDELGGRDVEHSWLIERALASIARMDQLIGRMLTFASFGGHPEYDDVDLNEVVDAMRQDLAAELAHVDLVVGRLPVVREDATQWRMVLQNLVSNAVKFTRHVPNPQIRVTGGADERFWHLEVGDNGPGVPEEDRERVFGLLSQGDSTVEGIGLGLATCMRIVAAHQGAIWMEASPEGGALVRIRVPRRDETASELADASVSV